MNKITKQILKEFDEEFSVSEHYRGPAAPFAKLRPKASKEIKDFLTHALTTYRDAIIKEVEGMKKPALAKVVEERDRSKLPVNAEWNSGIDSVISLLKE